MQKDERKQQNETISDCHSRSLCVVAVFVSVWQVAAARRAALAASSAARTDTALLTAPASLLAVLAADAEELLAVAEVSTQNTEKRAHTICTDSCV